MQKLFLLSVAVLPVCIWALRQFQARLAGRVRVVRESSAEIGNFLLETLLGVRVGSGEQCAGARAVRFRARNRSFVDALLRMQIANFLAGAVPGVLLTVLYRRLCFCMAGAWSWKGACSTGSLAGDDGVPRAAAGAGAKPDGAIHQSGFGAASRCPGCGSCSIRPPP